MNASKTVLRLVLVVSWAVLVFHPTSAFATIHKLTILHTSNHNGHFLKFSLADNPDVGGMAARSTIVNIVRAEVEHAGGHVLLLDAGNINFGTPESDLLKAEPDFKLMALLGYDAMALGYFELEIALDTLLKQRRWAEFPFLAANVVKKESGELLVDPYLIKEFDGLRVAIFGLRLESTPVIASQEEALESRSAIETAQALVPTLRAEADLVMALTNIGFDETVERRHQRTPGDVQLAQAVPGIDVIVGGGSLTGTRLEQPAIIGGTLIVQPGDYGLYVGRLDLLIDSETDTLVDYTYKLIPVNLKKAVKYQGKSYYRYVDTGYVEDPAVLELMQPYLQQFDAILSQPIGEAFVRLDGDREVVRYHETNLGNLATDSMRDKTMAEIALCNGGGIQASIEPGPITYRDVLRVFPFRNTLVLMDMTGEQIMAVLNHAVTLQSGSGGFLHASGLTWTNNRGAPEQVLVGGIPLEMDRMYKVVTNSYLTAGGNEYVMFKDISQYDTGFVDTYVLRDYIIKLGKVAPTVEGRITIIE